MQQPYTTIHAFALFLGLGAAVAASAQYDTVFVGDFEAISNGPFETPFPTSIAGTARIQYRFSAEEMMNVVPPGMSIHGVTLELLSEDGPDTDVEIELRMKNTVTLNSSGQETTGLTFVCDTAVHLYSGEQVFLFDQSPFLWTGAPFNVLLDVGMHRLGTDGLDPQVALDTSFDFVPTYYLMSEGYYDINVFSEVDAQFSGPFQSRPVFGFLVDGTTNVQGPSSAHANMIVYPNPANDRLVVRPVCGRRVANVEIISFAGAVVRQVAVTAATNGQVTVPLEGLAPGPYVLRMNDDALLPIGQQRIVVR